MKPSDAERTIWEQSDRQVVTLDQTCLPFERVELPLENPEICARAIKTMQVRGAPLLGAVGAYGLAMAISEDPSDSAIESAFDQLLQTRPTAVNLRWALERVRKAVDKSATGQRAELAWAQAREICELDLACNYAIGQHAIERFAQLRRSDKPLQIMTHCNAGRIATVGWGTAIAPIYLLAANKQAVHVWVSESRPRNQGFSLTAWELADAGIAHTVITDSAAGLLLMRDEIDLVLVGADRVAANGDVVNKIGTYLKALAAREHRVPFYVACPTSTIDPRSPTGAQIPIEQRASDEVTHISGQDSSGNVQRVRLVPAESQAQNPAFDVTPADMVTGLITEKGICAPSVDSIAALELDP